MVMTTAALYTFGPAMSATSPSIRFARHVRRPLRRDRPDRRPLASRARHRVQEQAPVPDAGLGRQREVVDAFLAALREGDFEALLEVLDPDVVLRADAGTAPRAASREVHGAQAVAGLALTFSQVARFSRQVLVNGAVGLVTVPGGELLSVMGFTIKGGKFVEIDILADAARLALLDLTVLDDRPLVVGWKTAGWSEG
jgi:hypothetical protein